MASPVTKGSQRYERSIHLQDEMTLSPVKILLRDEMYPKYNFLKRRLLSIYPRFKAVIEKGELCDLIPGGMELFDQIDKAQDKLKRPPVIFMIGNHNAVTEARIETNLLVSTQGMPEEFQILKKPEETEFKAAVKGIAEIPSVIVRVVDTESYNIEQAFTETVGDLVLSLPPKDRESCVLTTESFGNYSSLNDFSINGNFSDLHSVANLIQNRLEEKVIRVLKMIEEFIQRFSPDDLIEDPNVQEQLSITITKSLQKTINECNLGQEIDVQFDKQLKAKVEENPDIFKKTRAEIQLFYDNFGERMSDVLERFEEEIKNTFLLISKLFPRFEFEINGIFRQANLDASPLPTLPKNLKRDILSLQGVYGCGLVYGDLAVHVRPGTNLHDITDKIRKVVKKHGPRYMDRFEVNPVQPSRNAGVTYESGKSLRMEKAQDQNANEGLTEDKYICGTLGCFVKGLYNEPNLDNYTEQMYALSCAHIFPRGCGNIVEINQAGSVFNPFGIVSEDLTILEEHTFDIAAIVVDSTAVDRCNVKLKNTDSFEGWESDLHTGEISDLVGSEVFKFGSVSDLTKGLIVSHDYHYQLQELDSLDENFNILIEPMPSLSDDEFSRKGDSGTVVCLEIPDKEKVVALSMINGALYIPECNGTEKKYLCSYSCHLHKNIQELSRKTNIQFKIY